MSPKNLGLTGLFVAFVVALPLFVWTAINVNFNVNEKAQGEPNSCGGTCGSNYNCKANLFCYTEGGGTQGYCRNPICSTDSNCVCDSPTPTVSTKPTLKSTIKPTSTSTSEPKGGSQTYVPTVIITISPTPTIEPEEILVTNTSVPENMFFAKYAFYIFVVFAITIAFIIYIAIRKNKSKDIPHISPPTNV